MNLGGFRRLTAGLSDDYELVTHPGDATYWELHDIHPSDVLPASTGVLDGNTEHFPPVIILDSGQEITEDYNLPGRLGLDD